MSTPALTVWYDGACPLCRREIALMRRLDWRRRVAFVNLSEAAPEACPLDPAALLARMHAGDGERLYDGAAAFAALWRQLPLLWPLGQLVRIPAVLNLLERAYLRFLRWRPRLQRWAGG